MNAFKTWGINKKKVADQKKDKPVGSLKDTGCLRRAYLKLIHNLFQADLTMKEAFDIYCEKDEKDD